MPASPRPRRLHYWGSNALIYIAQECTTRGLRCLHLHVQEHNSRYARLKRCPRRRELKKMPASPRHTRVERYACRPPCARPKDARVGLPLHASRDGRVYMTRAKMHASPAIQSARDGRVQGGYRDRDLVLPPPSFKPRSPHDQEQREEVVWL